ncbi:MAG: hypothetical protein AB1656_12835 [Candidatus Omnitrophota bacterium]
MKSDNLNADWYKLHECALGAAAGHDGDVMPRWLYNTVSAGIRGCFSRQEIHIPRFASGRSDARD